VQIQPVLLNRDKNEFLVKNLGNFEQTFLDRFFCEGILDINGAKFHDIRREQNIMGTFWIIFDEIFHVFLNCGDVYLPQNYEPYGVEPYMMDGFMDMIIHPNDIVIDAGAWIGDFSAYCSVKGAKTYAFEPSPYNFTWLIRTASLNKNIFPVPYGLAETDKEVSLHENIDWNSGMSFTYTGIIENAPIVRLVSLDNFVRKEKLDRIDFIKCDIEGFERFFLEGARDSIRRFHPKISMCTYHCPDDRQVLMAILLDIEPRYTIWFSETKMYCRVI
jgi:FkbM family methyltransferase